MVSFKIEQKVTFESYLEETNKTAIYPKETALEYLILKLNGESGELAEALGKHLRGDYGRDELTERLLSELGDVLWYCFQIAKVLGRSIPEVLLLNIKKIRSRKKSGTIQGDGENR